MPTSKQTRQSRHHQAESPTIDRGNPSSNDGRIGAQQFRNIDGKGLVHMVKTETGWNEMSTSQVSTSSKPESTILTGSGGAAAGGGGGGGLSAVTATAPLVSSGSNISMPQYDPIGAAASGIGNEGYIAAGAVYDGDSPGTFVTHFLRKDGAWADVSASLNAFVTWSWVPQSGTPFTTVADSSADAITVTGGTGIEFTNNSSGDTDAITVSSTIPNLTVNGAGTVHANNYSNTNYYLDGVTKSGNTLTFSVSGASNPTYTFGSNAFNSTAYLTGNEAIALSGDISGTGSTAITTTIGVNKVNDTHIDWGTGTNQVNTDDIPEGSSNKFTSNETIDDRVNALVTDGTGMGTVYDDGANTLTFNVDLNGLDTADLSEGSNLYHTTARARAAISGSDDISYNSSTGVISYVETVDGAENTLSDSSLQTKDGFVTIFKELSTQKLKFYVLKAGDNITLDKNNDTSGGEADTYIEISASDAPTTNRFTGILDDGVTTYTASGATDTLKIAGGTGVNTSAAQSGSTVTVTLTMDIGTGASQAAAGNHTHTAANVGLGTSADVQFDSFGVGTAASSTTGEIRATNEITAYYSDDRLKTKQGNIEKALEKVCSLNGFHYQPNELAGDLGYDMDEKKVGVSAQEVLKVLPEAVTNAPIDPQYHTVQYEKLVPLLIEAIKELNGRKCSCGSK